MTVSTDTMYSNENDSLLTQQDLKKSEERILKSTNENPIWQYLIPIFVAFMAGILTLFQIKSNTFSAARIKWTENLRSSISEYIAISYTVSFYLHNTVKADSENATEIGDQNMKMASSETQKLNQVGNRIRLYLNSNEELHKILEDLLDQFEESQYEILRSKSDRTEDQLRIEKEIISISKSILKESWEHAKSTKIREIIKFRW